MGLGPVQPVPAKFQRPAKTLLGVQAAAKTVPCFQDNHAVAAVTQLTGSDKAGQTGSNDDHVGVFSHVQLSSLVQCSGE
jgi:hypothetical protein